MRHVTIKTMKLQNFRGAKERTFTFYPSTTTISGANGTGKSTIKEAFLWCLFGKTSDGKTDYDIKRRENNNPLQMVDAIVEVELDVDGQTNTLKRVLHEKWQKPVGETELVFKGNETQCFVNDVPCKVSEYNSKIEGIIPTEAFQLLTDQNYFLNLDWKKQREILFKLVGVVSDEELASGNADFINLVGDLLANKTIDEYRKELTAKKRKAKEQLDTIQPKIDQTQKLKPESENWGELEKLIAARTNKIERLNNAKADESQALALHLSELREIELGIDQIKKNQQFAKNRAEADTKRDEAINRELIKDKDDELTRLQVRTVDKKYDLERKLDDRMQKRASIEVQLNSTRDRWAEKNREEYQGETTCPHCHQQLPEEQIAKARELFNIAKVEALNSIRAKGVELTEDLAELDKTIDSIKIELEEQNKETTKNELRITHLKAELKELEGKTFVVKYPAEVEEYEKQIAEKAVKLSELRNNVKTSNTATIDEEIKTLADERQELINRLSVRESIKRYEEEIKLLEAQGRELSQLIADIEKEEKVARDFTRAKITATEERINSLFTLVRFQLFSYTQDGNEQEVCIPIVSNATYGAANKASQMNAGIDCINTMSRHFGVTAPIFIDNSESVNEYINTDSQMIFLKVTTDKELVVE